MSRAAYDAVVIGAGVQGAGAAYHLARSGWRVLVVDAGEPGGGSSGATHANLALHNRNPRYPEFALARATVAMYADLERELETDLEFSQPGGLMLAAHVEDLDVMRQHAACQRAAGLRVEMLDAAAVRALDPGVAPDVPGGLYCPESAWVNPLLLVAAYARAVRRLGGEVWRQTPVVGIRTHAGRVVGVQTPRGVIATAYVINAAGAGAGAVAAMVGAPFAIRPVWGQVVVTEPVPSRPVGMWNETALLRCALDKFGVRFVATRVRHGNLLIGRCEVAGAFHCRTIAAAIPPVVARARRFLPWISDLRVFRVFAGIRPFSPDGRAAIGLLPQPQGVAFLAGFGDIGIGQGVAARLLAQTLCGQTPDLPLAPFDPARFFTSIPAAR
jgi:glycine/D-amino acid oxidase-like deaminating enzyme